MNVTKIIKKDYHKFETDPATQLKYHRRMTIFWITNFLPMNVIAGVDIWAILAGHEKMALIINAVLIVLNTNYSLYANLDTEMGDAHGAYASLRADQIQDKQIETKEPQHELTVTAFKELPHFAVD